MIEAVGALESSVGVARGVASGTASHADVREVLDIGGRVASAVGAELGRLRAQTMIAPAPAPALPAAEWPDALRRGKAASGIGLARSALDAPATAPVHGREPGEDDDTDSRGRRSAGEDDDRDAVELAASEAEIAAVRRALEEAGARLRETGSDAVPFVCLLPGELLLGGSAPHGTRCTLALLVGTGRCRTEGDTVFSVLGYADDRLVASGLAVAAGPPSDDDWCLAGDDDPAGERLRCTTADGTFAGRRLSLRADVASSGPWRVRPAAIRWP